MQYLAGGQLPSQYRDWVEHDLTAPGWRNRQALRLVIMSLPFPIIFLLLPGSANTRISLALFLLACSVGMGYATGTYFRNRRLAQHGLPVPAKRPTEDD